MTQATVLLDIDGTLVDSNYHHTLAWSRALHRAGLTVPLTEIHRTIGMGADQLIARLAATTSDPLEVWWHEEFEPLMGEIRPTRGGLDLIRHLAGSGITNVYATSGSPRDVGALRHLIGADPWIAAEVNSGEVAASKPDPEIFELAMRRVNADPHRTIVIGDSEWDVRAAIACGLGCVAVECGGISAAELLDAGALAVYRDPLDVLRRLATSPLTTLIA